MVMKTFKAYREWVSLIPAAIALGITVIFYFKRVFFSDTVLTGLTLTQYAATIVTVAFALAFIRSRQSKASLFVVLIVIYAIMNIEVGIH